MKPLPSLALLIVTGWSLNPSLGAQSLGAQEIVRRSVERDRINFSRGKDYTYIEQVQVSELDKGGKPRRVQSETFDVTMIGEQPYRRLIAKNGKDLTGSEAAKAQRRFEEALKKRQTQSEAERRTAAREEEQRRQETHAFMQEVPEAFDFSIVGADSMAGIPVWVIDAKPKPGFRGKAKHSDWLPKFQGRIWIDQKDFQWVRVEAETIAPVNFGWILAKLGKGSRMTFEQTRVNEEVWLPVKAKMDLKARLAILVPFSGQIEVTWRDYRKFRTDSRVLTMEPAEEPSRKPQ